MDLLHRSTTATVCVRLVAMDSLQGSTTATVCETGCDGFVAQKTTSNYKAYP